MLKEMRNSSNVLVKQSIAKPLQKHTIHLMFLCKRSSPTNFIKLVFTVEILASSKYGK